MRRDALHEGIELDLTVEPQERDRAEVRDDCVGEVYELVSRGYEEMGRGRKERKRRRGRDTKQSYFRILTNL